MKLYRPPLPHTTRDREKLNVTIKKAQAALTISGISITYPSIYMMLSKLTRS
jgi:hypothetical protein